MEVAIRFQEKLEAIEMGRLHCTPLALELVPGFAVTLFQVWNWLWVQVVLFPAT